MSCIIDIIIISTHLGAVVFIAIIETIALIGDAVPFMAAFTCGHTGATIDAGIVQHTGITKIEVAITKHRPNACGAGAVNDAIVGTIDSAWRVGIAARAKIGLDGATGRRRAIFIDNAIRICRAWVGHCGVYIHVPNTNALSRRLQAIIGRDEVDRIICRCGARLHLFAA